MSELAEEQRAQIPCFVAFGACGHIIACAVDHPGMAKDNAREVARWIRDGLRIEKLPVSEVRSGKWCDCERPRKRKASKANPSPAEGTKPEAQQTKEGNS